MRDFGYFLQFLGCVGFIAYMLRPTKYYPDEENNSPPKVDSSGELY